MKDHVTFHIDPQGPENSITVTATKHNCKPRESTCQVGGKGQMISSEAGAIPDVLSLKASLAVGGVRISCAIPPEDEGRVSLKAYDISGREAKCLLDSETQAGWYEAQWKPPASGVYILVLRTPAKALTARVVTTRR